MKNLIIYEFKKAWNKVSILAVAGLILFTLVSIFLIYLNPMISIIKSDGEIVEGIASFRELRKEAESIKGEINQEYLDKLVENYNDSKEKELVNRDHMSKYKYPNYIINFIGLGNKMGANTIDLDYDFLNSEDDFYKEYRKTLKTLNKKNNEDRYTQKQIQIIDEKIDNMSTPLKVGYNEGLSIFIQIYGQKYWLVLVVIAFGLSTIFSKDSHNGIQELSLVSKLGRKKNMNAKVIAGNCFAIIIYMIFIATILLIIGPFMSLDGWNTSIQTHWYNCFYNMSLGNGIIIMILMGFVGVIVITNLVMLISIKCTNSKISTALAIIVVCILLKLTYTINTLQLKLNPIFFGTSYARLNINEFESFYFIGNIMLPYSMIIIFLATVYILIIRIFTIKSYKKYKLN